MAGRKTTYRELSSAPIGDRRNLVISETLKDGEHCGFTLAQQIEVEEGRKVTKIFLRNGVHVANADYLEELRDALTLALEDFNGK